MSEIGSSNLTNTETLHVKASQAEFDAITKMADEAAHKISLAFLNSGKLLSEQLARIKKQLSIISTEIKAAGLAAATLQEHNAAAVFRTRRSVNAPLMAQGSEWAAEIKAEERALLASFKRRAAAYDQMVAGEIRVQRMLQDAEATRVASARASVRSAMYPGAVKARFFSTTAGKTQMARETASAAGAIGDVTGALQAQRTVYKLLLRDEIAAGARRSDLALSYSAKIRAINMQLAEQRALESVSPASLARMNMVKTAIIRDRTTGAGAHSNFMGQASMLANFMALGGAIAGTAAVLRNIVGLDLALRNLQGITQTTDAGMASLKKTILELSSVSKFSAKEVADAGTILGQAGLSARQTGEALRGVILLAQGAGIDLPGSVNLITSAMGAFSLQASDSEKIANTFTAALNNSKLTIDQLSTAFQYAAAPAAQLGMTYQETTTLMMAMAQAGVKSGSIIGTGIRQVLNQLAAPTPKLKAVLEALKIPLNDVDIQAHGMIKVLQTLQASGFGVAEAFKAFGTRGAGAFAILANQADRLEEFHKGIVNTQAAVLASQTQMRAFANEAKQAANSITALGARALTPTLQVMSKGLSTVAGFARSVKGADIALQLLGTELGLIAAVKAAKYIGGLLGITTATKAATAATAEMAAASAAAQRANLWLLGITVLVSGAITAYSYFANRAAEATQKNAEAVVTAQGKYEEAKQTYQSVGEAIERLSRRQNDLKKPGSELNIVAAELQERFGNLGLVVDDLGGSYDKLRQKMDGVSIAARNSMAAALADYVVKNKQAGEEAASQLRSKTGGASSEAAKAALGLPGVDPKSSLGQVLSYIARGNDLTGLDSSKVNAALGQMISLSGSGKLSSSTGKAQFAQGFGSTMVFPGHTSQAATGRGAVDLLSQVQALVTTHANYSNTARSLADVSKGTDWLGSAEGRKITSDIRALQAKFNDRANKDLYIDPNATFEQQIAIDARRTRAYAELKAKYNIDSMAPYKLSALSGPLNTLTKINGESLMNAASAEKGDAPGVTRAGRAETQDIQKQLTLKIAEMRAAFSTEVRDKLYAEAQDLINQVYALKETTESRNPAYKQNPEKQGRALAAIAEQGQTALAALAKTYQEGVDKALKTDFKAQARASLSAMETALAQIDEGGTKSSFGDVEAALAEARKKLLEWYINQIKALGVAGASSAERDAVFADYQKRQAKLSSSGTKLLGEDGRSVSTFGQAFRQYYAQTEAQNPYSGMSEMQANIATGLNALNAGVSTLRDNLGGTLADLLKGTKSLGDAFKDLAGSITNSMLKVVTDRSAQQFMGLLMGSGKPGDTGGWLQQAGSWIGSLFGAARGGSIPSYAMGSMIKGSIPTRDSVLGAFEPGGFILRQSAVNAVKHYARGGLTLAKVMPGEMYFSPPEVRAVGLENLHRMNKGLASGGVTDVLGSGIMSHMDSAGHLVARNSPSVKMPAPAKQMTNVYVVAPDHQPPTTKNDILVTISQDILTNGMTKKLIKQVVQGG